MRTSIITIALLAAMITVGCADQEKSADDGGAVLVDPGKADNFYSDSAQEYYVSGEYYIDLEASYEDRTESERRVRVEEMVYYKQVAINWFLLQFLMDPADDHENKYQSLTKNGSYEDLAIRVDDADPLRYWFQFRQEVAGQMDLVEALSPAPADDGTWRFFLPVGKVPNAKLMELDLNDEWYREKPWSGFDPTKVDEALVETVELTIAPQPRSYDAWPDYQRLFADGEVTIGIHWGWDYHKAYHLVHSRDTYNWLTGTMKFASPVASYDEYTRTSGPLTRTIQADGKPVLVKIWLHWGDPEGETNPDTDAGGQILEDDMKVSFKDREVIVFSGHSGPFYGFALANWRKTDMGDIDDSEIAALELPADTYQVVLAEGCDTYAMGEAFWANPAKAGEADLDVITTTNFSNASTAGVVQNFLRAMVEADYSDSHEPWTYGKLLKKLDGNSYWFHSMYGVHGIDDNPRLHPYAKVAKFCTSCSKDTDCGGYGNKCVRLGDGEKVCTGECISTDACPAGYECRDIAEDYWISSRQCVPMSGSCAIPEPEVPETLVVINELLADPPSDHSGDANGDGTRDPVEDEFIELLSRASEPVDLAGWTLSDNHAVRFVFPAGAVLLPGRALLVFGGGDESLIRDFETDTGAMAYIAAALGLNNDGDRIQLLRPDGTLEDEVTFGVEGGQDRSLVRETEGDPDAPLILHPGEYTFTPGTKIDGTLF